MKEKCTHETSIVLQDCNGFSILQCTWACGLQLIELHLDNHEVETFTAQDLARITAERDALNLLLWDISKCVEPDEDDIFLPVSSEIAKHIFDKVSAALKS